MTSLCNVWYEFREKMAGLDRSYDGVGYWYRYATQHVTVGEAAYSSIRSLLGSEPSELLSLSLIFFPSLNLYL